MGKKKSVPATSISFPVSSDPFRVAGLATLIAECDSGKYPDISYQVSEEASEVVFTSPDVHKALMEIYNAIGEEYFDVSGRNAVAKNEGFYYDRKSDRFVRYPKVNTVGYAALIRDSRPIAKADSVKMDKMPPELMAKVKEFTTRENLPIPKNTFYLDDRNTCVPAMEDFNIDPGNSPCIFCGRSFKKTYETKCSSPLLGGSSAGLAFVSGMKTAEKACWKCLYLNRVSVGRFLYYYTYSPETVYAFGFAADTFEASLLINNQLLGGNLFFGRSQKEACDYMRNFDVNLLDSQQKPMVLNNLKELLLALLYSIYSIYQTLKSRDDSDLSALMGLGESLQYHCQVFYIKAGKYGKTFRPSNSGIYNDLDFLFRLFDRMEQEKVQMQSLYWQLLNYSVLESTRPPRFDLASLERDDFADKVLSQKSVLPIVTRLVFLNSGRRMDHLIRFVQLYESFIKYGGNTNMTDEIKELAIKLGSQIGTVTAADDNPKAGKGKILQLRKCLTLLDFLNVINSLQVRYNLIVNHDILKVINEDNFEYIKQFSVIQALNVYNFKLSKKQNDGEKNE